MTFRTCSCPCRVASQDDELAGAIAEHGAVEVRKPGRDAWLFSWPSAMRSAWSRTSAPIAPTVPAAPGDVGDLHPQRIDFVECRTEDVFGEADGVGSGWPREGLGAPSSLGLCAHSRKPPAWSLRPG